MESLSIHHIGNKTHQGSLILSEQPVELNDEVLSDLLKKYFLSPFLKPQETYHFYHGNGSLELNELYHFSSLFFHGKLAFHELSTQISRHLYEVSTHPQIKEGELYVTALSNVVFEGESHRAVGIFKSENKESYLRVQPNRGNFDLDYEQEAININKLDKGCIILDKELDQGFVILALDQTNRQQEAVYWKDKFLQIRARNDSFNQTGSYLKVYKDFVNEKIDESFDLERTDKIDLLNKSMEYFKKKEVFNQDEFEEEVIGNSDAAALFATYRQQFESDLDVELDNQFEISDKAVKKMHATFKSVLKLDKNFHIYVHGKREMIEKGFDDAKGLHYYKVYFEKEL